MSIKDLEPLLPQVRQYLATQPVVRAWVFGSYATGKATEESDVDILAEYDRRGRFSLLTISGITIGLEDILRQSVDLVERERLFPHVKPSAERDKILIYERETP